MKKVFLYSAYFFCLNSWAADLPIYSDELATDWQDWSWSAQTNYGNKTPVHSGQKSISVELSGWGGLQIGHSGSAVNTSPYQKLSFWIHGGTAGGQPIQVHICTSLNTCDGITQDVVPQANTWTRVDMPLAGLPIKQVFDIQWFNNSANSTPTFYVEDILFVASSNTPSLKLRVDATKGRHAISPYIYGMNFASEDIAKELRLPVRRFGGNSTTRYNWQLNIHNTANDWFFENIVDPDPVVDRFIEQDRRTGRKSIITVPLIGFTPKQQAGSDPDCGFKVSKYGPQDSVDSYHPDCGNGMHNGVRITGNDPTDTSLSITPAFVADWVNHLVSTYGTAAKGGVMFYGLDNEPMIWGETHRDVHPNPTSYDELRDRTWAYAAAIKSTDPTSKTMGPVGYGWCEYFFSEVDECKLTGTDYLAHNSTAFVEWYLQQMKAYQDAHGVRILDYLDEHYYPAANGVVLSPAGDITTQKLRLRSTRSLWDPNYVDESWIAQTGDPVVRLIPRMRKWISKNYPGTKLAITEYNWGALDHINGALAQADVLGIFGRERVDLAALWDPPSSLTAPGIFAFRMFRNYDGRGNAFGGTTVYSSSNDQDRVAIYGAIRKDRKLTLMVINKTEKGISHKIELIGFSPAATAQVYRYSAANLGKIVHRPNQPVTASGFTATFPANSISLFVVPPAQ